MSLPLRVLLDALDHCQSTQQPLKDPAFLDPFRERASADMAELLCDVLLKGPEEGAAATVAGENAAGISDHLLQTTLERLQTDRKRRDNVT